LKFNRLFLSVFIIPVIFLFFFIFKIDYKNNSSNNRNGSSYISNGSGNADTTKDYSKYLQDIRKSPDGNMGFTMSTDEIMANQERYKDWPSPRSFVKQHELEGPDRSSLPDGPGAREESIYPYRTKQQIKEIQESHTDAPQTQGIGFTGSTLAFNGAFPPDNMGAAGPSQYMCFVNGRVRTFNKTTGIADGVINVTADVFFASVMTPPLAGEIVFTSDPNVRFDRANGKWVMTIIDAILNATSGAISRPNRILIAVSSGSVISGATVWTFFQFQASASLFCDYPSLGIDNNALYIGGNMFTLAGAFAQCDGYVIRKSSIMGAGPLVLTTFAGIVPTSSGAGPWSPRGVDNFTTSTEGYFIGPDNATFNTLMLRRISDPGGTPTISANISIPATLTTKFPLTVPHLGNTGGTNGNVDALDDRLYSAVMRNGRLWTAHSIGVANTGIAGNSNTRNAVRWYEVQNLNATPSVVQAGTIFDPSAAAEYYWNPSLNISGQGYIAIGFSHAGASSRLDAGTSGRLPGDAAGTMRTVSMMTTSSFAYNPTGDTRSPKRWGDYSFTCVDPDDDMTMWTIEQFCDASNSYGSHVRQLLAPPPARVVSFTPPSLSVGASLNVDILGAGTDSAWYDPGVGFTKRLSVTFTPNDITVNSITFTDGTHITVNVSTLGATPGNHTVTVKNPDNQQNTSIVNVGVSPVELSSFTSSVSGRNVTLKWTTTTEQNNSGFDVERKINIADGAWTKINFTTGHGTTNEPVSYFYKDVNLASGNYSYRIKQVDYNGNFTYYNLSNEVVIGIPGKFELSQNYPNPFNPSTRINIDLPVDSKLTLKVYDISGKEIAVILNNEQRTAGYHSFEFNASGISSGVYFYRLTSENFTATRKMLLVK
jgi:hypothetical protein